MASNTDGTGSTRPPRILLVDDNEDTLEMMTMYLEFFGCSPSSAATFEMAKVRLSKESYDVVILDVELRGGNGLDLAALIRSGPDFFATDRAVPIIIASGHTRIAETAARMGLEAEVRVKPLLPDEVVSMLSTMLPWHIFKSS